MEIKKKKLIEEILKMNLDFTTKNIPIVFDKIKAVKNMDDTEFNENPELGREAKEEMLLSLQQQMGHLGAMQSETMKFTNIILHLNSDDAINQLEELIKTTHESNKNLQKEIENNVDNVDN